MGPDLLDSISTLFRLAQHWPGLLGSTLARARSARHWLGPARLDIDPNLLDSTSTLARSSRYRPELARINIGIERLSSTWAGPAQLDMGMGQLDSISDPADLGRLNIGKSARLSLGLTWLDFGPKWFGSNLAHTDTIWLGPGRVRSTWTWADFAQPGPESSWLNLDRTKSKSNPKYNLNNPKMYPIYI